MPLGLVGAHAESVITQAQVPGNFGSQLNRPVEVGWEAKPNVGQRAVFCRSHICAHRRPCHGLQAGRANLVKYGMRKIML